MATTTFKFSTASSSGTDWTNPSNCVDDTDGTYTTRSIAKNTTETTQYIAATANNATTITGNITAVEIGVEAKHSGTTCALMVEPRFNGSTIGTKIQTANLTTSDTTPYVDITNDTNAPSSWTTSDLQNLDIRLYGKNTSFSNARTISVDQIYIRVTYVAYVGPEPPISTKLKYYFTNSVSNNDLTSDDFSVPATSATIWIDNDNGTGAATTFQNGRCEQVGGTTGADGEMANISQDIITPPFDVSIKIPSAPTVSGFFGCIDDVKCLVEFDPTNISSYLGSGSGGASISYPLWLRIQADSISSMAIYRSSNGTDWTLVDSGDPIVSGSPTTTSITLFTYSDVTTAVESIDYTTAVDQQTNTALWSDVANAVDQSSSTFASAPTDYSTLGQYTTSTLRGTVNNNTRNSGVITGVVIKVVAKSTASISLALGTGNGTATSGISGYMSTTPSTFTKDITSEKGTWTWTDVNNLIIDIQAYSFNNTDILYISSIGVEVTYVTNVTQSSVITDDFVNKSWEQGGTTEISLYDNTTDMTQYATLWVGGAYAYAHLRATTYTGYTSNLKIHKGGTTYQVATQYEIE